MNEIHQKLLRALITAQVAVLGHADEDVTDASGSLDVLDTALKDAAKLGKRLRKDTP